VGDAITLSGVRKTFGPKVAVEGMDLRVGKGELVGFIGPNGAGKTTTIRMIMSIIFPDSGTISVLDRPSAIESKDRIGYLPEERGLYRKMKVGAFLCHMAQLKGAPAEGIRQRVYGWLERVGLADCYKKKCEELSKGMQQKVQFLSSVIHEPDLLILDEPFSGLDPVNMRLLRDLFLEQHQQGRTIIFSTHQMQQAEQLCDRIVMINRGQKVLDSTLPEIRAKHDPKTVLVEPLEPGSEASLRGMSWVREVTQRDGVLEVGLMGDVQPRDAIQRIVEAMQVSRIELRRPTLEDVFVEIAMGEGESAEEVREALRSGVKAEEVEA
jgi:ABC-2 type transport system ATP-binding protein